MACFRCWQGCSFRSRARIAEDDNESNPHKRGFQAGSRGHSGSSNYLSISFAGCSKRWASHTLSEWHVCRFLPVQDSKAMVKDDVLQCTVLGSGHKPPKRCLLHAVIPMGWASAVSIMQEIADSLTCIGTRRPVQESPCSMYTWTAVAPWKKGAWAACLVQANPCIRHWSEHGSQPVLCHLQERKLAALALFTSWVLICKVLKARWAPVGNACWSWFRARCLSLVRRSWTSSGFK